MKEQNPFRKPSKELNVNIVGGSVANIMVIKYIIPHLLLIGMVNVLVNMIKYIYSLI